MNCVNRFEQNIFNTLDKKKEKIIDFFFGSDFFLVALTGNKSSLGVPVNSVLKCSPESDHMFLSLLKDGLIWPQSRADQVD